MPDFKRREKTDEIIVHHTADTYGGMQYAKTRDYHVGTLGWLDIGYHYFIERSGTVLTGRPEWAEGAHAKGHNDRAIGVALAGDFTQEQITPAQDRALVALLAKLKGKYPAAAIKGHNDVNATACPGNIPMSKYRQITADAQKGAQGVTVGEGVVSIPIGEQVGQAAALVVIGVGFLMLIKAAGGVLPDMD